MNDDKVYLERHDNGIAVITFNRPGAMNALDMEAMERFAAIVGELEADQDVRIVIVAGAGERAFCSGGDLRELRDKTTEEDARNFITLMGDTLYKLEHLPVPVVAAINGYALGGGSEVAVACDMRIIDEKARMGFVQIRLALTPGWGAGQRLLRLLGYSKAMDALLHGHVFHARDLKELGLVNKVVDQGTALEHALYFARHVAERPPDVVRGIKKLLRAGLDSPYDEALAAEREIFPPLWAAQPHLDAVEHFLHKQQERRNEG